MEAKILRCVDCGSEFEFTEREAAFYLEKGWNAPRRCKGCREKRKPAGGVLPYTHHSETGGRGDIDVVPAKAPPKFKTNCAACGIETVVPFKPNPSRPAYCRACFVRIQAAK